MRTVSRFGVIVGALVCLSWATAAAQGERGVPGVRKHAERPHRVPHGALVGDLREALALTEEQAAAIAQEEKAHRTTTGQMREQIQKLEEETYQIAGTGDAEAVGRVVLQRISLQKQLEVEDKALKQRIDAILTPEQQEKLKEMMGSHVPGGRLRHPPEFVGEQPHHETEPEL